MHFKHSDIFFMEIWWNLGLNQNGDFPRRRTLRRLCDALGALDIRKNTFDRIQDVCTRNKWEPIWWWLYRGVRMGAVTVVLALPMTFMVAWIGHSRMPVLWA
jgi:hypothetical protein